MATSIAALILLFFGACGISTLFHKSCEESLPICLCLTVLWLYGFYCLGIVYAGLLLLLVLYIAGFVWSLIRRTRMLTPGMLVYAGLCLLFVLVLRTNVVMLHDELRLWAAVPKAIHLTGALQLGQGSPIFDIMQSYTPGLPLLEFFFTAFDRTFSESALFIGYACTAMAFFLPGLSRVSWKQWPVLAPMGLLMLLTPCALTSGFADSGLFGMSLFVDPMLGIVAGYCFHQAWHRPLRDSFHVISFSLSLSFCALLKDTGILFSGVALVCAVLAEGRTRRALIPAGVLTLTRGSWSVLLSIYGVKNHIGMSTLQLSEIGNLLSGLFSKNVVLHGFSPSWMFSFVPVTVVLAVVWALFVRKQSEQPRKSAGIVGAGILASTVAFQLGYAAIYGSTMESFERYMITPLLCLATCALLTGMPLCTSLNRLPTKRGLAAAVCCLCVLVSVGFFVTWKGFFPEDTFQQDAYAQELSAAVEQDWEGERPAQVYLVMAGDTFENSFCHHRMYFTGMSHTMYIHNFYTQTHIPMDEWENPAADWAEELSGEYDYVYIFSVEDSLIPVFTELAGALPEAGMLYRVTASEGEYSVSLVKAQ